VGVAQVVMDVAVRHPGRPLTGTDSLPRRESFAVQVLANGCYVAERTRPGQAIYGCGAQAAS
jgi:hypothetical protein